MSEDQVLTVEVFRPGEFTAMNGAKVTFSEADVQAIADAYDPTIPSGKAPAVYGHPQHDHPAMGWAKSFYMRDGKLVADVNEMAPAFVESIRTGAYRKVSMSFHGPTSSYNPKKGGWYPKHIGFLGAAAPAVTGLKSAELSAPDPETTFEVETVVAFAEPAAETPPKQESAVSDTDKKAGAADKKADDLETRLAALEAREAAFAEREADLTKREETRDAEIAALKAEGRHKDHVAFAAGLVREGRLTGAEREAQAIALLDGAATQDAATVNFADGEKSLADGLKAFLSGLPKAVEFGATDMPPLTEPTEDAWGDITFASAGIAMKKDPA